MTVDKPYMNGTHPVRDAAGSKLVRLDVRQSTDISQGAQTNQRPAQRVAVSAALDPVQVSKVSREMSAALGPNAADEVFDHDKVEAIRREILEGRFPIDEERLARK